MTAVPTILGHGSINFALKYIAAARVALATLSEPILAALVAYLVWNEDIGPTQAAGYGLVSLSVLLLVADRRAAAGSPRSSSRER